MNMQTNQSKMSQDIQDQQRVDTQPPNENTGLNIDEHVKIYDPNSQETLLEKRA
jgi:hypothetical protein